jgi:hypothetical protein
MKNCSKQEWAKYGYKPFTSGAKCRKCGSADRYWKDIGDDVYEDYRYECNSCGDSYVVEGDDG